MDRIIDNLLLWASQRISDICISRGLSLDDDMIDYMRAWAGDVEDCLSEFSDVKSADFEELEDFINGCYPGGCSRFIQDKKKEEKKAKAAHTAFLQETEERRSINISTYPKEEV